MRFRCASVLRRAGPVPERLHRHGDDCGRGGRLLDGHWLGGALRRGTDVALRRLARRPARPLQPQVPGRWLLGQRQYMVPLCRRRQGLQRLSESLREPQAHAAQTHPPSRSPARQRRMDRRQDRALQLDAQYLAPRLRAHQKPNPAKPASTSSRCICGSATKPSSRTSTCRSTSTSSRAGRSTGSLPTTWPSRASSGKGTRRSPASDSREPAARHARRARKEPS